MKVLLDLIIGSVPTIFFILGVWSARLLFISEVSKTKTVKKGKDYGAVFKPKTQEEIDKERNKKFYEEL